ncbi:hypothetical protein ACP93_02445 [Xanthomonas sp. NCPPB 1128]|uniref:hypothetical protein n=1 Tax=Xanthomonas sp. NCPPB 1128 TaxID=1775876 RepID=UPI00065B044D|nr:hypothetical protein [Xanthomonas sp. NCPPB 1128]KMM77044.1 hypothetical protein ACP93_02180 [Xanthomonas sp. NCPPB 1128]KMM77088.1 hypothetical protein ACP93_02445 [Xanthomonas sp. NCPPB 1128]
MTDQLFPRQPRRLKQPTKDLLRQHLASITEENIRLRAEVERLRSTWWRRLINRVRRAPKDIA